MLVIHEPPPLPLIYPSLVTEPAQPTSTNAAPRRSLSSSETHEKLLGAMTS